MTNVQQMPKLPLPQRIYDLLEKIDKTGRPQLSEQVRAAFCEVTDKRFMDGLIAIVFDPAHQKALWSGEDLIYDLKDSKPGTICGISSRATGRRASARLGSRWC